MNDNCYNGICIAMFTLVVQFPSIYLAYRLQETDKKIWKLENKLDELKEIEEIKIMGENDKTKCSQKKSYFS